MIDLIVRIVGWIFLVGGSLFLGAYLIQTVRDIIRAGRVARRRQAAKKSREDGMVWTSYGWIPGPPIGAVTYRGEPTTAKPNVKKRGYSCRFV
jgi:hypothetical protein